MTRRNQTRLWVLWAVLVAAGASAQRRDAPPAATPPQGVAVRAVNGHPQLEVNGAPFFVHAAAFPYFRLPADLWERSLEEYRALGINTIDLTVPWNWHAAGPGEPDFTGSSNPRRDLRRLLRLIAEKELRLLARPAASVDGWRNLGVPDEVLPMGAAAQEARRTAFVARVAAELALYVATKPVSIPDRESRKENQQKTIGGPLILLAVPSLAASDAARAAGLDVPIVVAPPAPRVAAGREPLARQPLGILPQSRIRTTDAVAAEFLAALLATQTFPAIAAPVRVGEPAPEDDVRAVESPLSDTLLRSRLLIGNGVDGIGYSAVQDSLDPAGFTAPGVNRFVRVDAALDINASRNPAARSVVRNGQLVDYWGALLASSHKRADVAVISAATDSFAAHWSRLSLSAMAAGVSLRAVAPESASIELLLQSPLVIWQTQAVEALPEDAAARLAEYAQRGGTLLVYPQRPASAAFAAVWAQPENAPGFRATGRGRVLERLEDPFAAVSAAGDPGEALQSPAVQAAADSLHRWLRVAQSRPVVQQTKKGGGPLLLAQLASNSGARPLGERERAGAGLLSVVNLGNETIEDELDVVSPRVGVRSAGDGSIKIPVTVPPQESLMLPLHASLCITAKAAECDDEIITAGAEFLWAEREGKQLELIFYVPVRVTLRMRLARQPTRVRTDEMSVDGLWTPATRQFEVPIPRGPAPHYLRVVRVSLPYEPHVPEKPDPDKVGRRDFDFAVADGARFPLARDAALETYPPLVVLKGDRNGRMVVRGKNYDLMGRGIDLKVIGAIRAEDGLGLDPGETGFERMDLKPNNGNGQSAGPGFFTGQLEAKSGRERRNTPLAFVAVDEKNTVRYEFDFDRDGAAEWTLEDDHLRVIVSPESGGRIVALVDKESGLSISNVLGALRDWVVDTTAEAAPPRDLGLALYRAEWTVGKEQPALKLSAPDVEGLSIEKTIHIAGRQVFDVRYIWQGPGIVARNLQTTFSVPVTLHGDNSTRFCWEKPRPEGAPTPLPSSAPEMQCEMFSPVGRPVTVPQGIKHLEVRTPGSNALRVDWPAGEMKVEMKNYSALLRFTFPRLDPGATGGDAELKFRIVVVE